MQALEGCVAHFTVLITNLIAAGKVEIVVLKIAKKAHPLVFIFLLQKLSRNHPICHVVFLVL